MAREVESPTVRAMRPTLIFLLLLGACDCNEAGTTPDEPAGGDGAPARSPDPELSAPTTLTHEAPDAAAVQSHRPVPRRDASSRPAGESRWWCSPWMDP